MKLSLGVIVKDEVEQVKRIIRDYGKYFDEMVFAVDDPKAYTELLNLNEPKARFYTYSWCKDFSHKRNYVHSLITGDYYVRIDCDDAILNPEKLRPVAEKAMDDGINIVVCYYLYAKDEDGNCNAAHYRETIIKKSDMLVWQKPIHENVVPKRLAGHKIHIEDGIVIDHLIDHEHSVQSIIRNLEYLIEEYNRDKENTDPRTLAYLGRTFFALKDFDKAIFFLQKHIDKSGWDEDRYVSWGYLAECFNHRDDFKTAISCANEALQERPDYPDAYFKLLDVYMSIKRYDKAIHWGEMGFTKKSPKTFMLSDPSSHTWRPALSLAFCYSQTGLWDKALRFFKYAQKLAPSVPWVKEYGKYFEQGNAAYQFNKNFMSVYSAVKKVSFGAAGALVKALPEEMKDSEALIALDRIHAEPKRWGKDEVCILCPLSTEKWSPKSIERGIGGSEEAVIRIAEQLTKMGKKVFVYNDCEDEEGDYNGVSFVDWRKFNPKDIFSTIIGWRMNIANYNFAAANRIVWIHDIPLCLRNMTPDEILKTDRVIVLSEYHRSLLPQEIPPEKVYVSTNGIVPEDFDGISEKRQKNRMIYASSYDRGLEEILNGWGRIRAEVPDAELHVFYGWETYDALANQGLRRSDFKERMKALMAQEGVYDHGRVGHKQLLREYAKSEFFVYPSNYVGEINCIALTKAIASGCVAITNDFAVLKERNPHYAFKSGEFIDKLIEVVKGGYEKKTDTKKYIDENSWETVATAWVNDLLETNPPVIMADRLPWIREQVDAKKKVVDIGCNKGHLFEGYDRSTITSVDIDLYDIQNFVRANAQELPFKDKEFDCAVLAEIVEHCPEPIKALSEARRVAKKVVITVPYEHKWVSNLSPFSSIENEMSKKGLTGSELAKEGNPEAKDFHSDDGFRHLYHETFYTPELLREHLDKAGYENYTITELRWRDWVWLGVICE